VGEDFGQGEREIEEGEQRRKRETLREREIVREKDKENGREANFVTILLKLSYSLIGTPTI
jgi:hypothetical protein